MTRLPCALTLLAVLAACATPTRTAQPTSSSVPSSTSLPALTSTMPVASTTTIVTPTAATGRGPESFTTGTVPGPVQVLVTGARCVRYAGRGWLVTYRITNAARTRSGAVLAQVAADGPQVPLVPNLTLQPGQPFEATQAVNGSGESVQITWANTDRPVESFPFGLPDCPVDPADERAARQATTTTGKP